MTLKEIIDAAQVDETVDISTHTDGFFTVKFTYDAGLGYTYVLVRRYARLTVFPMASSQTVKFWKTLPGAKRHFLKQYDK